MNRRLIGMINAHMINATPEPSEPCWSSLEVLSEGEWIHLLEMSLAEYAETSPHMIVFEVES